ncbi:hypothetical protein N7492_000848 [Penicillium capsulatum]|uniref:Uncharacterized protein n=1 Tax=Penicillium capsulatum TaxID=69766 RepID=A0A9W9M0I2_9EURO|nr:hypothetical protein N7492_000848 [Penicillium capsulatum]KAJ6130093.1 hypothetical protein N7512_002873 [Penicillium capsulatum]
MPPHESEVLAALKLLHDTPAEILTTHRESAVKAWRHVGNILSINLEDIGMPRNKADNVDVLQPTTEPDLERGRSSRLSMTVISQSPSANSPLDANERDCLLGMNPRNTSDASLPSGVAPSLIPLASSYTSDQPSTGKRKPQAPKDARPAKLLKTLKKRLPQIIEFSKQETSLSEILQNEQQRQYTDKRVDHLKQVEGNKTPCDSDKLLKGLSQISFARQFTAWESGRGWKPRIDELFDKIRLSSTTSENKKIGKKNGNITRYVKDHGYPQEDQNVVSGGIKKGISQLLFQKLLADSLSVPEPNSAVDGILALATIFEFQQFQRLAHDELPQLIQLLREEDNTMEKATSSEDDLDKSTLHSVQEISTWFRNMSSDFELIPRRTEQQNQTETHLMQPNVSVFSHLDSPGLTSTLQHNESSEEELYSSFPTAQDNLSDFLSSNTASHDLAEFSTYPNRVLGSLPGVEAPHIVPHELASFAAAPLNISDDSQRFSSAPHPTITSNMQSPFASLPLDPNSVPHELASFSTFPGRSEDFVNFRLAETSEQISPNTAAIQVMSLT